MGETYVFNKNTPLKVTGRGGTSFDEPIEYFNKNIKSFNCLIYFTDGEADIPKEKPKGPILWVHSSHSYEVNKELPGQKIKLEK